MGKSSLIFKVPLDGEYPEGTTVRTLRENEFLQLDGEKVYVYARDLEGHSHMVCGVDLTHRATPEWADERDDVQGSSLLRRLGSEGPTGCGRQNGNRETSCLRSRRSNVRHRGRHLMPMNGMPQMARLRYPRCHRLERKRKATMRQIKEHLTNLVLSRRRILSLSLWMTTSAEEWDSSGPASWDKILREMEQNSLEDVGAMNYREGVREEKWGMLDLKNIQFPKVTAQSVKRATLLQYFEVDFIRAMGIISPAAATYAKAVIAGVHRDLPVYRKRDMSTTVRDWTGKMVEELWHTRAEAAVNLALQTAGVSTEALEKAANAQT